MTHYEARLEKDLDAIRDRIAEVARDVRHALRNSIHALLNMDRKLAADTILGDLKINRAIREIDRRCHAFVALHLPSAGHLRFVSSVLRLDVAVERIGDYAATISREALQLSEPPPAAVARDIEMMADQSLRMFQQAMRAFAERSPELARGTKGMSDALQSTFHKVFTDLLGEAERGSRPVPDLFALLLVLNRLERVRDQSKNICEETIFTVTGETKSPKVYRILFVDEKNDGLSQIAEAMARKAFPTGGRYASAGWNPASALAPATIAFMDAHGLDHAKAAPRPFHTDHESLVEHHLIVSLQGDLRPHLEEVPFEPVFLEWDVGRLPEDGDPEENAEALQDIYKRIAHHVRVLLEALHGDEAS